MEKNKKGLRVRTVLLVTVIVLLFIAAIAAVAALGYQTLAVKEEHQVQHQEHQKQENTEAEAPVLRYYLSSSELDLFRKIVYAEAGISNLEEQTAVAAVILNRMDESGKSLEDVVFSPGQFEPAQNGEIYTGRGDAKKLVLLEDMGPERAKVEEAIWMALEGEDPTRKYLGEPALYFYRPEALSEGELLLRSTIKESVKIGYQVFYRSWD